MKTLLLTILLAAASTATCLAQQSNNKNKFSLGIEIGNPTDDGQLFTTVAVGVSAKYDLPVSNNAFFTLSGGYTSLRGKDGWASVGLVPLKAGIKYYFINGLYAEGQAGAVIITTKGGGTGFAYAPGVGYQFGGGLDIGLRYERWQQYGGISQVGLRLAYSF